jgi:hypothetical protein
MSVGLANGCVYSQELNNMVPTDYLIQAAAPPELFGCLEAEPGERRILHSVVKSFRWRCVVDPAFDGAVSVCAERHATLLGPGEARRVVLAYVLAMGAAPRCRLIYSSSYVERLDAFLTAIAEIERRQVGAEIVADFQAAYLGKTGR